MATCTVIGGRLNVRASKSATSTKLGQLANGTLVNVVCCNGTWATLMYDGTPAFVMHQYLDDPPSTYGEGLSAGDSAVCNANNVNIRSTANGSTTGNRLDKGDNVTIYARSGIINSYYWYRIGTNQWIRGDFLAPGDSGGSGSSGWQAVKNGSLLLSNGGSNDSGAVMQLQTYLAAIGYGARNVGTMSIDGDFGDITELGVRRFQRECGLSIDGIVGSITANKLESVQNSTWFTKAEYYPLKSSYMSYMNFPDMGSTGATERSIVVRAISGEHGYASSTSSGHQNARVGVAKVLLNRTNPSVQVNRASSSDYSFKSVYLCQDYTSKTSIDACYLPRGYSDAMQQMHDAASTVVSGNWPALATLVGQNHIYQKGAAAWDSSYESRSGYCRYPSTGSSFSFFYIS